MEKRIFAEKIELRLKQLDEAKMADKTPFFIF